MKKIAYIRVSTPDQRHDRQVLGLQDICDELHIETLSACSAKRPVYDRAVKKLKAGDMLVVWDLDRAFRSVVDALTEAEKLRTRGVHFQIANLHIDTSTPAGIFVYTMMSALAEFERRTLSQRTKEGLEAARRQGKRIGRPPVRSCPCWWCSFAEPPRAGFGRAGQAATAGRLTMGSSLIGAMLSSVM